MTAPAAPKLPDYLQRLVDMAEREGLQVAHEWHETSHRHSIAINHPTKYWRGAVWINYFHKPGRRGVTYVTNYSPGRKPKNTKKLLLRNAGLYIRFLADSYYQETPAQR
jgi:hypothetical protein